MFTANTFTVYSTTNDILVGFDSRRQTRMQKLAVCDIFIYDHNLLYTDQVVGGDLFTKTATQYSTVIIYNYAKGIKFQHGDSHLFHWQMLKTNIQPHTLHNLSPPQSHHREREEKKRKGENNAMVSSPS